MCLKMCQCFGWYIIGLCVICVDGDGLSNIALSMVVCAIYEGSRKIYLSERWFRLREMK
ncbi:hypothetical protein KP509_09G071000 [Ceratopteris richardii]|uniref:Uncharacterized protein n=1 Tax=Ceratopteris richardii TaxID=49495 RepID=A0A8T2U7M9_CERRI|nr:hypothetical protein KP509_09G071000 [Ceratopteris richardii]